MNNHRIQKFTSDGQFLAMWGSGGKNDGQFSEPEGLDVDKKQEKCILLIHVIIEYRYFLNYDYFF